MSSAGSATPTLLSPQEVSAQRHRLHDAGFVPIELYNFDVEKTSGGKEIPLKSRGKVPTQTDWQNEYELSIPRCLKATNLTALNTGILASGLQPIDIDIDDPELSSTIRSMMFNRFGEAPMRIRDASPRCLVVYRAAPGTRPSKRVVPGKSGKVEILGHGQQFHAFGIHYTASPLAWMPEAPGDISVDSLPIASFEEVSRFIEDVRTLLGAPENGSNIVVFNGVPNSGHEPSKLGLTASIFDVAGWVSDIPNNGPSDWEAWKHVGMALWKATNGSEAGRDLWHEWSKLHESYDPKFSNDQWNHFATSPPNRVGAGTLAHLAKQARRLRTVQLAPPEPDDFGGAEPPEAAGLPVIRIAGGELHNIATAGEQALIGSKMAIYQRGRSLVRPIRSEVPASRGRTTMAAGLSILTPPAMVDRLCRIAKWEKFDARAKGYVSIDPPERVATTILSRVGEWHLPSVAGVVTTPTIRPDGTLLTAPGYDRATRLYHMVDDALDLSSHISAAPTRPDALRALEDLRYLLKNFPIINDVDASVALSGLISPVARGAISVVPLHAFRASTAGTGKTFLVDVASAIATSRPCPVATVAKSEEETEKRLAGLLLAAFPLICLDNVNGVLGGDLLCQAIERPIVQIRPLGTSDIIEVESRASMFATGNMLRVRGDMTRRTLICNLDAMMERPELRTFDFDPVETVLSDRKRYVAACLTIVLAHAQAGFPGRCTPLGSFGDWSKYVRAALIWLGCADPCGSMNEAREDDPELTDLRELLEAWDKEFDRAGSYTVGEIGDLIADRYAAEEGSNESGAFYRPRMREIVLRMAGIRGSVDTRKLGAFLRFKEGRIVNGIRLSRAGTASGGLIRWHVGPPKS